MDGGDVKISQEPNRRANWILCREGKERFVGLRIASISRCVALACMGAFFGADCRAQQTQFQFLPEVEVFYKINQTVRLEFEADQTREANQPTQGEIGASIDFFVKSLLSLQKIPIFDPDQAKSRLFQWYLGYRFVPSPGQLPIERMEVGFVSHYPLPAKILLSDRNEADLDWFKGGFNWFYVNEPTLQREFTIHSYKPAPYVGAEFFYVSQDQRWSTTAVSAGVLLPTGKRLAFNPYYERENVTGQPNQRFNQLGVALHIFVGAEKKQ